MISELYHGNLRPCDRGFRNDTDFAITMDAFVQQEGKLRELLIGENAQRFDELIQNCIIHQLRNSSKYVSYKDLKALMADLKAVYAAVDEQAALAALDTCAEHWDKKYPKISQSWRENWPNLSTYFKYPQELRRLIYTTNAVEGFSRQLRKVTKAKSVFPTDDSLFKMLYLAMIDITKKWTGRRQDWSLIHAQMAVYFADRMPE